MRGYELTLIRDESRALLSCLLASTWLILPFYSSLAWVNLGVVAKFTWSRDQVYLEWKPRVFLGVQGGDGGDRVVGMVVNHGGAYQDSRKHGASWRRVVARVRRHCSPFNHLCTFEDDLVKCRLYGEVHGMDHQNVQVVVVLQHLENCLDTCTDIKSIHLRPAILKILPVGFHLRQDLGVFGFSCTAEDLLGKNLYPLEIHLSVDPDLIGPWLQQFWATASLSSINEVPHIRAMVAGKRVLISEETIRADLLFDDADGVDCFPKQVIWDSLRDIGYEGNLAQLTFSKPLFSPQWKYLVHVLLHCLSPKSTSWEQFGTNIASALVGLATNQKFNFSLMIMNGMLGHIANGKPFLMYPRFIQLFLNKQLEGVTRPQNFLPSVTLPSKVFTFMRKNSPKFSGRITPLTPPMLEVITALAAEEAHSTSPHSRAESSPRDAQGTPTQSAAQASILQGTADFQGTAEAQGAADIPQSPNDYTPTDESQTSGGDEGLLDLYALNREVRRLKKQTISQAKQIHKLKAKLKKLSKGVKPLVKHHILWVKSQKLKKRGKKQKKKVSSVKLGRNKDEGNLSEEHHDQDEHGQDDHNHTAFVYEDFDATNAVVADLEKKSDETEERKNLGNMISMKNEGTAQVHEGTARSLGNMISMKNEGTAQVHEGTARRYCSKLSFTAVMIQVAFLQEDPYWMITKRGRRLQGDDFISTSGEALAL
ncbi:hypothetical protein Tco_0639865 [Tanacetum coccineum]